MSRKNTILIAILLNLGLLAVLFGTALTKNEATEHSSAGSTAEVSATLMSHPIDIMPLSNDAVHGGQPMLSFHNAFPAAGEGIESSLHQEVAVESPTALSFLPQVQNVESSAAERTKKIDYIELKVKAGDTLAKLAKSNGVTVEEIKTCNRLNSDQLSAGQTLRIPLTRSFRHEPSSTLGNALSVEANSPSTQTSAEYYVVKSGDNPWAIANRHKIKVEDLLQLNHLDRETARRLKPGDKLRIR